MKSYIAVAAVMASVASAKPMADGWEPVYETTTTTVPPAPVYTTTTTVDVPVYYTTTTSEVIPVYTTPSVHSTVPVYTSVPVYSSASVYSSVPVYSYETTASCDEYSSTKPAKPTHSATHSSWEEWQAVSSIPYETTKKAAPTTTSWAVWAATSTKIPAYTTTASIPKYTGAASQQGVAFGAMALAGVAMLL